MLLCNEASNDTVYDVLDCPEGIPGTRDEILGGDTCDNCSKLQADLHHLKTIQIGLEKKMKDLQDKYEARGDKLGAAKKELTSANLEIQRLEKVVTELRTNRYISSRLTDVVNVCLSK